MKPLLLPPTVRTASIDEIQQTEPVLKRLLERKEAKIVEGYTYQLNEPGEFSHEFSAEINIDNDRLWPLFKTLLLQLPDEIACIYRHIDGEPGYGEYMDKYFILNKLQEYEDIVTQDPFIELGVIFAEEKFLEEIFIKKPKYIQYWGMDVNRFRKTMNDFNLHQIDDLNFIDEYPMTTIWLKGINPNVLGTDEFLLELDLVFLKDEDEQ